MSSYRRSRARQQRNLHALVWAGAVFAVVQLVGGLLLDYCWPTVRFPQAGCVLAILGQMPQTPDIVCLGSSRFGCGVREDVLNPLLAQYTQPPPRLLNASVGAGDPIVVEWMLQRMLHAGRRPTLLVVEITPENLACRNKWLELQLIRQLTWTDLPAYLPDACRYAHPMRLLSSRLLPLYHHRYQIRKQTRDAALALLSGERGHAFAAAPAGGSSQPLTARMHGTPDLPPVPVVPAGDPTAKPAAGVEDVQDWLRNYRLAGLTSQALERVLARCRAERIAVLLVAPPVSGPHRSFYSAGVEEAFQRYIAALTRTYGCRFADYRNRVPDTCFFDHHHLGAQGSDYFSRLLAREVLIPTWRALPR
jgi:hypothetical protein